MVEAYRAARAADEDRVDAESYGYATERQSLTNPPVTFRRWLQQWTRANAA